MPLPSSINDLSTTPASNYPSGTDAPSVLDDVQRVHASFIAGLRDNPTANASTPTPITKGGTGASTAGAARTALGAAASGANTDITSLAATGTVAAQDVTLGGSPAVSQSLLYSSGVLRGRLQVDSNGVGFLSSLGSWGMRVTYGTNNVFTDGSYNGAGTGLTGTAASLTAGAASTDSQHLGVSQTWQNMTGVGGRAIGATITNSTGKPIQISVNALANGVGGVLAMVIDGSQVGVQGAASLPSGASYANFTHIIPSGSTYKVDSLGFMVLQSWYELRT